MSNESILYVDATTVQQLEKALEKSYEANDELMAKNARLMRDNRRLTILVQELRINRGTDKHPPMIAGHRGVE